MKQWKLAKRATLTAIAAACAAALVGCGGASVVVERGLGSAINRPAGIGRARRTA